MILEDYRLVTGPGSGLLARFADVVIAIPELTAAQSGLAEELLELCANADRSEQPLPRRLAEFITAHDPDRLPGFCAISELGDKLSIIVFGYVEFEAAGQDETVRLSGQEAATWADRLLSGSFSSFTITSSGSPPPISRSILDLKDGVVAGGSVLLLPRTDVPVAPARRAPASRSQPARPAPIPVETAILEPAPPPVVEPEPAPASSPAVRPGREAAPPTPNLAATVPDQKPAAVVPAPPASPTPARGAETEILRPAANVTPPAPTPPAPVQEPEQDAYATVHVPAARRGTPASRPPVAPPAATPPSLRPPVMVDGVYCKDHHFNHPEAQFCRVDGLAMLNITRQLQKGPRPSLGRLDFDDGTAYELDREYIVGTEPALHELVQEGLASPIQLADEQKVISRRHAAIRLEGWDVKVVDLDSRNGTFVRPPQSRNPIRLNKDQSAILPPGSRVNVGDRSFVFHSHHKVG